MGNTQALPGLVVAGDATAGAEPYEVIYRQAMERIATLDRTWQDAVRGVGAVSTAATAAGPAATVTETAVVTAEPEPVEVVLAAPAATPPVPRSPVTVPARISTIPGPDTAEAVLARSEAPRWRRSLAY